MSTQLSSDELFDALVKRHESDTLDFKRTLYDFTSSEQRDEFVKDVICMANTPRKDSAYLVFGVDYTPETGAVLKGMARQEDGTRIVDQLNDKIVQPRPGVSYIPLTRPEGLFGILEIPVQRDVRRPFVAARDTSKMRHNDVYFRRDSQNTKANADELMRITHWFRCGEEGLSAPLDTSGQWETFLENVQRFETGRYFVLITDRVADATPNIAAGLGLAPWLSVIDFDPQSEQSGLLAGVRPSLEQSRSLQIVVTGQDQPIYTHSGTAWFFARGLAGRETTLQVGSYKAWLKDYGHELSQRIRAIAATTSPAPVTVVVLWSDLTLKGHVTKALDEVSQSFGEELTIVLVSPEIDGLRDVCELHDAVSVCLQPRALMMGLVNVFARTSTGRAGRCALPTQFDGIACNVDRRDQLWLEEELELLHLDVGLEGDGSPADFARGAMASWRDLQLRHDCDREITDKLRPRIERELKDRKTTRVNLYHAPGAGGTTVARRVLWDLHSRYPCAVLHRSEPRMTADRLGKIYALTGLTVLLLIDGGEHTEGDIDQLYDTVRSQQTPVVMLQVLRRFNAAVSPQRDFLLKSELTPIEADRFQDVYTRLVPDRAAAFQARAMTENQQERTAFYFGLEAFGRDFRGLPASLNRGLAS